MSAGPEQKTVFSRQRNWLPDLIPRVGFYRTDVFSSEGWQTGWQSRVTP